MKACFRHFPLCFHFNSYTSIKLMSFCAHVLLKYLNKTHFLLRLPWRSYKFASLSFSGFFWRHKLGYLSWVIPLYILLSEPVSSRLLNSISSKLCHHNTQFKMYTKISKKQEGSTCKDSYPKCFITTNFDKFTAKEWWIAVKFRERVSVIFRCVSTSTSAHRSNSCHSVLMLYSTKHTF